MVYTADERSLRDAWEDVVGRLEAEAVRAGAHGVLGVSVSQTWTTETSQVQIQLLGTAVRQIRQTRGPELGDRRYAGTGHAGPPGRRPVRPEGPWT